VTRPVSARDLLDHRYVGRCPDEVQGWDSRDPLCWACKTLDRVLEIANDIPVADHAARQETG